MDILAELADNGLSGCSVVVQICSRKEGISSHIKGVIAALARVLGYRKNSASSHVRTFGVKRKNHSVDKKKGRTI